MDYDREALSLEQRLCEWGYHSSQVKKVCLQVRNLNRTNLPTNKSPQQNRSSDLAVFSTNYSLQFQDIRCIMASHLPALYSDDSYKAILERESDML